MLRNASFEAGYVEGEARHLVNMYEAIRNENGKLVEIREHAPFLRPENNCPDGWEYWFYRDDHPPEWDLESELGHIPPETRLAPHEGRMVTGHYGYVFFAQWKIFRAGLRQTVAAVPGRRYRADMWAHWWCSQTDNPLHSEGVGEVPAFFLESSGTEYDFGYARIGIDPTGGVDPFAETVVWAEGAYSYNRHHRFPAVEVEAVSNKITVFFEGRCRWRFKHNDFYVDDVSLKEVESPAPMPPGGGKFIARGTKVGYHAIGAGSMVAQAVDLSRRGAPVPLVKFVDDWAGMDRVRIASPSTLILARKTFGLELEILPGLTEMTDQEAVEHATHLMGLLRAKCMPEVDRLRHADYLETVVNEADPKTPDGSGYRRLALMMIRMMDIAETWDLPVKKLALFSLNAGTPEWVDYEAMVGTGVFERMQRGGHVLSLHEGTLAVGGYTWENAPIDLWWGPGHTIPGAPEVPGSGALCFRYRYLLHLLRQRGVYVPIVISEWYGGQGGYNPNRVTEVMEAIRWYDEEAAKDPELLAFTPFTFGGTGYGWDEQDYDFLLPYLVEYTVKTKDRVNAAPGSPTSPSQPGLEHQVTVNLLPQDSTLPEVFKAVEQAHADRQSFVYSADDAAYLAAGGQPGSKVVVWDGTRWPGDIDAYLGDRGVVNIEWRSFDGSPPPPKQVTGEVWDEDWSKIVPRRNDCALFPGGWARRTLKQIRGVTFHHTYGSLDPISLFRNYLTKEGCRPAGPYTLWIRRDGKILKLLELEEACYHDHTGYPNFNLSVGVEGMLNASKPTPAQLKSMVKIARWAVWNEKMSVEGRNIRGHMDRVRTDCPGWAHASSGHWRGEFYTLWRGPLYESIVGVHGAPVTHPPQHPQQWIDLMNRLGVKHFKMLDAGEAANVGWCKMLWEAGINVLVRLYQARQFPGRQMNIERARRLIDVGARWFETGNEPNLDEAEWKPEWHGKVRFNDTALMNQLFKNMWLDSKAIIAMGGNALLYAMAPTDVNGVHPSLSSVMFYDRMLDWLYRNHRTEVTELLQARCLGLAVHSGAFRPFDFQPRRSWGVDDMCLLGHEPLKEKYIDAFGVSPVVMMTEGHVYSNDHLRFLGWTPWFEDHEWGAKVWQGYEFLQARHSVDAVFAWTWSDQGVQDARWLGSGWLAADGSWRSPIRL